jgi:hypothetical protein
MRPEVAGQHMVPFEEKYPRRQECFLKKPQEKKSVKKNQMKMLLRYQLSDGQKQDGTSQ